MPSNRKIKANGFSRASQRWKRPCLSTIPNSANFRTIFYWSSSAGKKRTGIVWPYSYERDIKSARATKILLNPLDIDGDGEKDYYAISDWDDDYVPGGNRGKASRSEVFRIRAFRIDLDPYEY